MQNASTTPRSFAPLRISAAGSRFARSPPALSKRTTVRASNGHAKRLYYSQILRSAQDFGCRLPLRSFSACPEQTNDSESVERACKTPLLLPDPSLRSGFRLQAPASLVLRLP